MKTKIGFIDYHIDNFHANKYPDFISESPNGGDFEITLAWEEQPKPDGKPLDDWCKEMNIAKAGSIEQVVDECDAIFVLSPDNPERHEDLADLPLKSGKPVYVDKTFAPDCAAAKRMIDKAVAHNTPMFSTSALRYSTELVEALNGELKDQPIQYTAIHGAGRNFEIYIIHQMEMLPILMGVGAKRVMHVGTNRAEQIVIDYGDDRRATIRFAQGLNWGLHVYYGEDKGIQLDPLSGFFEGLMPAILDFFKTRQSPVPFEQTLEIARLIDACQQARTQREQWISLPTV